MSKQLLDITFTEHHKYPYGEDIAGVETKLPDSILFKKIADRICVEINPVTKRINTSTYMEIVSE